MNRSKIALILVSPAVVAVGFLACADDANAPPGGPDSGIDIGVDGAAPTSDAGGGTDETDAADARSCTTPIAFWDAGPLLVPTPYRQASDSPFACVTFGTYFHLANFEGDSGLPPGTTGPGSKVAPSAITDSVDGDDGFPDGAPPDSGSTHPCPTCQSWFGGPMDFTFDEVILGGLPTHAGMVWTDDGNGATVNFTAYDAANNVIATQAVPGIGTPGISGQTDEDRFFGVVFPGGVKRITMSHTGGGIEIDHLQIGR